MRMQATSFLVASCLGLIRQPMTSAILRPLLGDARDGSAYPDANQGQIDETGFLIIRKNSIAFRSVEIQAGGYGFILAMTRVSRLVNKYNLFVLEVLKAWTDPKQRNPKPSTITDMPSLWSMAILRLTWRLRVRLSNRFHPRGYPTVCAKVTNCWSGSFRVSPLPEIR